MHSVDQRPPTGLFKAIVDAVVNIVDPREPDRRWGSFRVMVGE